SIKRFVESGSARSLMLPIGITPGEMRDYMDPTERMVYDQLQEDTKLAREKGRFALLEKYDPLAQAVRYGDLADQEAEKGLDAMERGDSAVATKHFRQSGRNYLHVITNSIDTGETAAGGVGLARGIRLSARMTTNELALLGDIEGAR